MRGATCGRLPGESDAPLLRSARRELVDELVAETVNATAGVRRRGELVMRIGMWPARTSPGLKWTAHRTAPRKRERVATASNKARM